MRRPLFHGDVYMYISNRDHTGQALQSRVYEPEKHSEKAEVSFGIWSILALQYSEEPQNHTKTLTIDTSTSEERTSNKREDATIDGRLQGSS